MKRLLMPIAVMGALAACTPPDPAPDATDTPTASDSARAKADGEAAKSKPHGNGARAVSEETDDFLFEYAYPAEAGRIPELAQILDNRLDKERASLAAESENARREARQEGFPYNKHSYSSEWKVVAELPGFLSLSQHLASYTGGAHGNSNVTSMIWDKTTKRAVDAKALFTSPEAFEEALGSRFCDGLDRERKKRRPEPLEEAGGTSFTDCPKIGELTLLLGSSNHRTFNRLTLYAGPYVAGPYVEGAYQIDLNIDREILDTVRPEYREAFSARN